MSVLWLTTEATPAPRSGGALRSLRLVQALARRTEVHVVNLGAGIDETAYCTASGAASLRSVPLEPLTPALRLPGAVLRRQPLAPGRLRSRAAAAQVAAHDGLVVCEHTATLGSVPRGRRVAVLLQNVDSELLAAMPTGGHPARRLLQRYDVGVTAALERRLERDPRVLLVAASQRDAAVLGPGTVVAPNGTDLPDTVPALPRSGPVLFTGSMGYPPNVDAVRWWQEEIGHRDGLPPLTVVGQDAEVHLRGIGGETIDLVGTVPDMAPWLARSRVVVVPIRSGSGTRLKVLEALAFGRPVVSTTKGAEGFPVRDGEHLLLADTADAFATSVRRLLDDHDLSATLGARGRALAADHDWRTIGDALADRLLAHA